MKLTVLDEKMSIRIESDTKDQVIAYGWVLGFEGSYSDTIRHILRTNLPDLVKALPEDHQKDYEKTLGFIQQKRALKEQTITGMPPADNHHTDKENENDEG